MTAYLKKDRSGDLSPFSKSELENIHTHNLRNKYIEYYLSDDGAENRPEISIAFNYTHPQKGRLYACLCVTELDKDIEYTKSDYRTAFLNNIVDEEITSDYMVMEFYKVLHGYTSVRLKNKEWKVFSIISMN